MTLGFYAASDISTAKVKLLSAFPCLNDTTYAARRQGLRHAHNTQCVDRWLKSTAEVNCALNIIVRGVAENRNPTNWRESIDDALQFVTGRPVEVADIVRVSGVFKEGRTCPVLVELRFIWGHRIILSLHHKLRDYSQRIYVYPDEPLENRRQQTLERKKSKAEIEGKPTVEHNGELIIDSELVFLLQKGYIRPVSTSDNSS